LSITLSITFSACLAAVGSFNRLPFCEGSIFSRQLLRPGSVSNRRPFCRDSISNRGLLCRTQFPAAGCSAAPNFKPHRVPSDSISESINFRVNQSAPSDSISESWMADCPVLLAGPGSPRRPTPSAGLGSGPAAAIIRLNKLKATTTRAGETPTWKESRARRRSSQISETLSRTSGRMQLAESARAPQNTSPPPENSSSRRSQIPTVQSSSTTKDFYGRSIRIRTFRDFQSSPIEIPTFQY
jgi:hypothetical protein